MQTRQIIGLALSLVFFGISSVSTAAESPTWYVSPNGNDAWSGRLAQSGEKKDDGPLATLAAAVEASRTQATRARRIVLAPGQYYLEETVVLDARDADLTIQGAGAGRSVVYGGRRISGWQKDGEHFWAADVPEVKAAGA